VHSASVCTRHGDELSIETMTTNCESGYGTALDDDDNDDDDDINV